MAHRAGIVREIEQRAGGVQEGDQAQDQAAALRHARQARGGRQGARAQVPAGGGALDHAVRGLLPGQTGVAHLRLRGLHVPKNKKNMYILILLIIKKEYLLIPKEIKFPQ